jgi:transposase
MARAPRPRGKLRETNRVSACADQSGFQAQYRRKRSADLRYPGRPPRNPRDVVSAILWVVRNGEKWQRLPATFPPSQTCYIKWLEWRRAGTLLQVFAALGLSDLSECNSAEGAKSSA